MKSLGLGSFHFLRVRKCPGIVLAQDQGAHKDAEYNEGDLVLVPLLDNDAAAKKMPVNPRNF